MPGFPTWDINGDVCMCARARGCPSIVVKRCPFTVRVVRRANLLRVPLPVCNRNLSTFETGCKLDGASNSLSLHAIQASCTRARKRSKTWQSFLTLISRLARPKAERLWSSVGLLPQPSSFTNDWMPTLFYSHPLPEPKPIGGGLAHKACMSPGVLATRFPVVSAELKGLQDRDRC